MDENLEKHPLEVTFSSFQVVSMHPILGSLCIIHLKYLPDLLQLLVCCRVGDEQPVPVAHRHPAQDPAAADGGVHHGDDLVELGLEGGVEVLAAADGDEAVRVGQLGEHAHLVVVLEVSPHHRHD